MESSMICAECGAKADGECRPMEVRWLDGKYVFRCKYGCGSEVRVCPGCGNRMAFKVDAPHKERRVCAECFSIRGKAGKAGCENHWLVSPRAVSVSIDERAVENIKKKYAEAVGTQELYTTPDHPNLGSDVHHLWYQASNSHISKSTRIVRIRMRTKPELAQLCGKPAIFDRGNKFAGSIAFTDPKTYSCLYGRWTVELSRVLAPWCNEKATAFLWPLTHLELLNRPAAIPGKGKNFEIPSGALVRVNKCSGDRAWVEGMNPFICRFAYTRGTPVCDSKGDWRTSLNFVDADLREKGLCYDWLVMGLEVLGYA